MADEVQEGDGGRNSRQTEGHIQRCKDVQCIAWLKCLKKVCWLGK